jgi:hypothetical protein
MVAIADRAGCAPVPLTARLRGYSNRALPRSEDAERCKWIAMADAALLGPQLPQWDQRVDAGVWSCRTSRMKLKVGLLGHFVEAGSS